MGKAEDAAAEAKRQEEIRRALNEAKIQAERIRMENAQREAQRKALEEAARKQAQQNKGK